MDRSPLRVRDFALPDETQRVDAVFVNGVPQVEGRDYRVDGPRISFVRPLRRRTEVGVAGWILTALCAGVDAEGDSADAIILTASGRRSVALVPDVGAGP